MRLALVWTRLPHVYILLSASCSRAAVTSSISMATNSSASFPLAWYLTKKALASSCLPWAYSHRGDSGMKEMPIMTVKGRTAWTMDGMRQDQCVSRCPVPKHSHPAMMDPTYHRTLNCEGTGKLVLKLNSMKCLKHRRHLLPARPFRATVGDMFLPEGLVLPLL